MAESSTFCNHAQTGCSTCVPGNFTNKGGGLKQTNLEGKWTFRQTGTPKWKSATVPGCVHTDLIANKQIPDPFKGLNDLSLFWIEETSWEYKRTFKLSEKDLSHLAHHLVFEGLDTIAEVFVNGKSVGKAENMFRRYTFEAKNALRVGQNEILVAFKGPTAEARKLAQKHGRLPGEEFKFGTGRTKQTDRNQIRKAQYQFGWDWGPYLPTTGIWKGVTLISFSNPRIENITVYQTHSKNKVALEINTHWVSPVSSEGVIKVRIAGVEVETTAKNQKGRFRTTSKLSISNPKLWWPAGYGDPNMYILEISGKDSNGNSWDESLRRTGLRKVELIREDDKIGQSFFFKINGVAVYAKGSNWIPADIFPSRVSENTYVQLIQGAVAANMNMLRIWGGGIYESDKFYELCDENGLMIWHDHMFACAAYPAREDFLESVGQEITDQVRRLGTHPSIVLWCGNNENETGMKGWWTDHPDHQQHLTDYQILTKYEEAVTKQEAPDTPWWPSSPSSGGDFKNPADLSKGDSHFWDVWHGRAPFRRFLEVKPRFQSEFGFQSFPSYETLKPVLGPEDKTINSPNMEHHQRSGIGNTTILETASRYFRIPTNLDDLFYVSQIVQAMAIRRGVEHWRRIRPICMGTIYWQYNDCWPVASWSSIDSGLRWKALNHAATNFYAPLLVSAFEEKERIALWATSDVQKPLKGSWTLELWSYAGKRVDGWSGQFDLPVAGSKELISMTVEQIVAKASKKDEDLFDVRSRLFLVYKIRSGSLSNGNTLALSPLKRAELPKPKISMTASASGRSKKSSLPSEFKVTVKSEVPAIYVQLRCGAAGGYFSENFFDLLPNKAITTTYHAAKPLSLAKFKKSLKIRSLRDTY